LDASADISVILTLAPEPPADLAERFKPGKYAVYVIGDVTRRPSSSTNSRTWPAVSRAGLVMLAGFTVQARLPDSLADCCRSG
jgi:hypothetical protein